MWGEGNEFIGGDGSSGGGGASGSWDATDKPKLETSQHHESEVNRSLSDAPQYGSKPPSDAGQNADKASGEGSGFVGGGGSSGGGGASGSWDATDKPKLETSQHYESEVNRSLNDAPQYGSKPPSDAGQNASKLSGEGLPDSGRPYTHPRDNFTEGDGSTSKHGIDKPDNRMDGSKEQPGDKIEKKLDSDKPSYDFTYEHEIGHGKKANDSLRPHFPESDESGVTIGPGYDMGNRKQQDVKDDLQSVGVDKEMAEEVSKGAGLKGQDAKKWVDDWQKAHPNENAIEEPQQRALFEQVNIPQYEQKIQRDLSTMKDVKEIWDTKYGSDWNKLSGVQKEMLFDVEYNPGLKEYPNFTKAVLNEDWKTVGQEHQRYLNVNGEMKEAHRNQDFEKEWGYLWK